MKLPALNVLCLDGAHGRILVERDLSLGHHRIRLGPIRLFWKSTPGWEINFISDDETLGFQVVTTRLNVPTPRG